MAAKKAGISAQLAPACLRCGASTKLTTESHTGINIRSYVCQNCGWSMTHPDDSKLILLREKGIRTSIGKLGRQTILRIPAEIREMYKLDTVKDVMLKPIDGKKLIIEVTRKE